MSDQKPADRKQVDRALSDLLRVRHNANRVNWNPTSSWDPADRQKDRAALNAAILRAAGRTPPDEADEPEPQTFPWRSLGDDAA